MKYLLLFTTLMLINAVNAVSSDDPLSGDRPFVMLPDVQAQADAWTSCAAIYEVAARNKPAQESAHRLSLASRAAAIAAAMTLFLNSPDKDVAPNDVWADAKADADSSTRDKLGTLLASDSPDHSEGSDLAARQAVCDANTESRQGYVELWKELFANGVLALP